MKKKLYEVFLTVVCKGEKGAARRCAGCGVLAALLMAVMALANPVHAATTTLETGPITQRVVKSYTFDCDTGLMVDEAGNKVSDVKYWSLVLWPGDSIEFVPAEGSDNAMKGFIWPGHYANHNGNYSESRDPITVTKRVQYGEPNSSTGENWYIQGVRNDGDSPVYMSGGGGGGGYTSDHEGNTLVGSYGQWDLNFFVYPNHVNMIYELYDNSTGESMSDELAAGAAYYTDEENPTVTYASDAYANYSTGSNIRSVGLAVTRPYVEGYNLTKADRDNVNGSLYYTYDMDSFHVEDGYVADGYTSSYWGDSATIYPEVRFGNGESYVMSGSCDDYLFMRFRYNTGTTVTFNAMGGTIDGYDSRIYEFAVNSSPFWIKVKNGIADEELAEGTAWVPEREGYVFCGWYIDEACSEPMESFSSQFDEWNDGWASHPSKAYHLYAKWRIQSSVTLADVTASYTGEPVSMAELAPAIVEGSMGAVSYEYFTDAECTQALNAADVVEPGTYYVRATVAEDDTCTEATSELASLAIVPSDIANAEVKLGNTSYTYDGTVKTPGLKSVVVGGRTLNEGSDYTVDIPEGRKNAGTYTYRVTGLGNYTGMVKKTFTIKAKAITPVVTLSNSSYTWNGTVRTPGVTVKTGSTTLKKSTDYTFTYAAGRKNVGLYKVTVKMKGNYSGTKTVTFKINPKGTTVKGLTAARKAVTVKWNKQAAKMNSARITGYQIQLATNSKYTKNKKTVTVSGYSKVSKKVTRLKAGKKYYVRIRTYKTISGKKYYSPWSKAKSIRL